MKKIKILLSVIFALALILAATSCSASAPYIGENGNWFVDGEDTGVLASGEKGDTGDKGIWGATGKFKTFTVEKVSYENSVATYKIKLASGEEETFTLTSGKAPEITSCEEVVSKRTEEKSVYEIVFDNGYRAEFEIKNGKDGTDGTISIGDIKNYDIIKTMTLGQDVLTVKKETLSDGEYLYPTKGDKALNLGTANANTVTVRLDVENLLGASIRIGYGDTGLGDTYAEINEKQLVFYHYDEKTGEFTSFRKISHKLEIKNYIQAQLDILDGFMRFSISSDEGGMYTTLRVAYPGGYGDLFVKPVGVEASNVELKWFSNDFTNPVYIFTDSLAPSTTGIQGWSQLLRNNGYKSNALFGKDGMSAGTALDMFKTALEFGTPKYAVWSVGASNPDSADAVNAEFASATEEFLTICEQKGIIPILATTPSLSDNSHAKKNEMLRNLASTENIVLVDFDKAVVNGATGECYSGMKDENGDLTQRGVDALYMQILVDFPEIELK